MKWENVDLKHGFILLDKTKNGERREIPINDTLRSTLEGLPRRLDGGYVFYDPSTGSPYGDIKNSFKGACKRAGIRDFHFHDLRHTFASHLVMAGIDIATVRELLGHKTLTMTLRYAHLALSKVKAVEFSTRLSTKILTIQILYKGGIRESVRYCKPLIIKSAPPRIDQTTDSKSVSIQFSYGGVVIKTFGSLFQS